VQRQASSLHSGQSMTSGRLGGVGWIPPIQYWALGWSLSGGIGAASLAFTCIKPRLLGAPNIRNARGAVPHITPAVPLYTAPCLPVCLPACLPHSGQSSDKWTGRRGLGWSLSGIGAAVARFYLIIKHPWAKLLRVELPKTSSFSSWKVAHFRRA
jgi:hypothetical protein